MKKNKQISSISKANFLQSVKYLELKIEIEEQDKNDILKLAPSIHHKMILWKIRQVFNGNATKYKQSIKQFFLKFTPADKKSCECDISNLSKPEKRKARKKAKKLILYSAQLLQLIGLNGSKYLTSQMFDLYKQKCEKDEMYARASRVINPRTGKLMKFSTPLDKQNQRKAEYLNIIHGLEKIAQSYGWIASFVTLTLPPAFHPNPSLGKNSYNGASPDECRNELSKYWQQIRSRLAKHKIIAGNDYFGSKTVEAHQDSTLHSHALIFHPIQHSQAINDVVIDVGTTNGANFDCAITEDIKNCAMYQMKYMFKSFDNENENINFFGKNLDPKKASAMRTMAVRDFYNLRGYSFFGLDNKKGAWDFLCSEFKKYKSVLPEDFYQCLKERDFFKYHTLYKDCIEKKAINNKFIGYEIDFSKLNLPGQQRYVLIEKNAFGFLNMDSGYIEKNKINLESEYKTINNHIYSSELFAESLQIAKEKDLSLSVVKFDYYLDELKNGKDFFICKGLDLQFSQVIKQLVKVNYESFESFIRENKEDNLNFAKRGGKLNRSFHLDEDVILEPYNKLNEFYEKVILIPKQSSDLLKSASQFEDIEIEDTEYS